MRPRVAWFGSLTPRGAFTRDGSCRGQFGVPAGTAPSGDVPADGSPFCGVAVAGLCHLAHRSVRAQHLWQFRTPRVSHAAKVLEMASTPGNGIDAIRVSTVVAAAGLCRPAPRSLRRTLLW